MKGAVILPIVIAILLLGTVSSAFALTLEAQIPIGKPNGIDVDPSTNLLYATSYTDSKVYVIDGNTNTIIDDISVGSNPHQVAFNPVTNLVYVTNQVTDTVSVIDVTTNLVIHDIPVANGPLGISVNPNTNMIYVASGAGGTFTVIDGASHTVVHSNPLGNDLSDVEVNPNTNLVYVTQSTSSGTVHVLNTLSPFTVLPSISVGIFPGTLTVHQLSNTIYVGAGSTSPAVYAIDGGSNTLIGSSIPLPGAPFARAMTNNPDTNRIFIATEGILHVVDGVTKTVVDTHTLGATTYGMTMNPITNLIYTADNAAEIITVLQDVPPLPPNIPPTSNPGGPYSSDVGVSLNLDGSGSSDPDGTIVQYDWRILNSAGTIPLLALTNAGVNPILSEAQTSSLGVGSFLVELTVKDSDNDYSPNITVSLTLTDPPDSTPPVITLVGDNPQKIHIGSAYTELGATASDDTDGNITPNIVTDASAVNTGVLGSYSVTYNVSDTAGNPATQVTRTVDIVETKFQITKNTIGGDGSFSFNFDNIGGLQIKNIPDTSVSNIYGPELLSPGVEFTITENTPAGWNLLSSDCEVNGISVGGIVFTPQAGDFVECIYTNEIIDSTPPVIPDSANVAGSASIGDGTVLGENVKVRKNAVVGENVTIGDDTKIRKNAQVGNGSTIGSNSIVAKNAIVGENVTIGDDTKIRKNVTIGDGSTIGSNSIVAKKTVVGENVTIGDDTKIRKNVTIGNGAIIGDNVIIRQGATVSPGAIVPDGTIIKKNATFP